MNVFFRFTLIAVLFLSTTAVIALPQESLINEIEFAPFIVMPEELLHRFAGEEGTYRLFDIRPWDRFARAHIRGGVHLEWPHGGAGSMDPSDRHGRLEERLNGMLSPDIDVFIIDEAGEKSFELLRYLLERGYSTVWVVEGGMQNWPYREYLETSVR